MKSDKGENKNQHISVPQKDAIAIVPPKKVRDSSADQHHVSSLVPASAWSVRVDATYFAICQFPITFSWARRLTYDLVSN